MNRTRIVLVVGACIAVVGALVCLRAGDLATNWQPGENGSWGGLTDPALRRTYSSLGLAGFVFGLVLLLAAAWRWMTAGGDHRQAAT